jgi:aminoglycoside phosphotransferase (APT) family kinase protein
MALLGAGMRAEVFAWEPGIALKLDRHPGDASLIELERAALAAANAAGIPAPRLHGRVEVDGRPGLLLERLEGEDLLATLSRRPWRAVHVARAMGEVHAALHRTAAPPSLPSLREVLEWRIGSDLVPPDIRDRALRRLESLPDGDRLLHGDFHPANLLPGREGPVAIDWTNAARGDPAADVARTRIIIQRAPLPASLPRPAARLMVRGRELLLWGYLREYSSRIALDRDALERWEPVWAAARLSEDIPEEREGLLELARS